MASLEVAAALAPYSRYSSRVRGNNDSGWDWTAVLDYLTTHPQPQGDAFGRAIVNSYKSFTNETGDEKLSLTAYSVSQLTKAKALTAVLDQIAVTLQSAIANYGLSAWWAIAVARRKARISRATSSRRTATGGREILDLPIESSGMLPDSVVATVRCGFLSDMVVSTPMEEEKTLRVDDVLPRYSTLNTNLLSKYRSVPFSASYHALIDSYTSFASSDQLPYIQIGVPPT